MSAARDLALWVKLHAPELDSFVNDHERALALANIVLEQTDVPPGGGKSIEERAHEMWIVAATSGEIRIGPSGADIVRTIRAMDAEIATATPFPARQQVGPGLNSFPPAPDPLADF